MDPAAAANLAVGAAVLLTGVSLLLAIVGFVSFARLRHGRLLWVAFAFVGFVVQGAGLAWWGYQDRAALGAEMPALALLNLAIVACLYLAVLKR